MTEDNTALVLEINSQTDFVAMSDVFIELTNKISQAVFQYKPKSLDEAKNLQIDSRITIEGACQELTAKIGEKTGLRRFVFINKKDNEKFAHYVHNNRKIAVILVLDSLSDEIVGRDVSMHAAAMKPKFLNSSQVDQA
jgi:elongation factor Ts